MTKSKMKYYIMAVILLLTIALLTMSYIGRGLFEINNYNSYSIQASAWLNGRLDIPSNYSHLEIAVYEGRYYISFPPFPSMIMLPFVVLFGQHTPDHLIALIFACISLVVAIRIADMYLHNIKQAVVLAMLLVLGSNYFHVLMWGSVWYIAQNMAFAFTLLSIYLAITDKKKHSYMSLLFLCAAAGCRPFQLIYAPLIILLLYKRNSNNKLIQFVKQLFIWAIPAVILGIFYMILNYARFGSIFEFGHNYLPEFTESLHGQFSSIYIIDNLKTIFFKMPELIEGVLTFPSFDGVALWIVSPILIIYSGLLIHYIYEEVFVHKNREMLLILVLSLLLSFGHLVLLSMHKTLGGYHFGNRYTIDILPIIYYSTIIMLTKAKHRDNMCEVGLGLMIVGLMINVIGTILL